MTAPTLFDELAGTPPAWPIRPRPGAAWCPIDERTMTIWREHGIPADLSTVETACQMLFALHHEYRALRADLQADLEATP